MDERHYRRILRSAFALSLATPAVVAVACGDAFVPATRVTGDPRAGAEAGVPVAAGDADAPIGAPIDCDAATLYGRPQGQWDGGVFQNRDWEAGVYWIDDSGIQARRK